MRAACGDPLLASAQQAEPGVVVVALTPGSPGVAARPCKWAQAYGLLGRSALVSRRGAAAGGGRALGTRRPVARQHRLRAASREREAT